ncbi:MAG: acyltransferase [Syntrophales bacterium]|nr:acyltransferase [Syntrophales bacterium]
MFRYFLGLVRGVVSLLAYAVNTIFAVTQIFPVAFLKLVIPLRGWRKFCDILLTGIANNWIAVNNFNQRCAGRIRWDVSGLEGLKRDDWYLVLSNHQSWVDILVLQRVFYRKIPCLKFFIKKELIWVPLLGFAWWALDFPFMKRYSQAFLEKHPHLRGKDLETTRKACEKFKSIPVSVMNFVEGTRFSRTKHRKQRSPHTNLLRPKAGGVAFVFQSMGEQLHSIVDVTIAYPEGAKSFWQFLCGRVNEIKVRVNAYPISRELLGDYFNDSEYRERFQKWLTELWEEKDRQIEWMLSSETMMSGTRG